MIIIKCEKMKKLNFKNNNLLKSLCVCLLFIGVITLSCSDAKAEDTLENHQIDEEKINNLFTLVDSKLKDKIQTMRQNNGDKVIQKVISFLIIMDNTTGKIGLANFKEENYFAPITYALSSKKVQKGNKIGGGYTVSCTGGSEGDWEKECSGKISCGRAIADCLDQGGCAKICENEMQEKLELNAKDYLDLDYNESKDFENIKLKNISAVKIVKIP